MREKPRACLPTEQTAALSASVCALLPTSQGESLFSDIRGLAAKTPLLLKDLLVPELIKSGRQQGHT